MNSRQVTESTGKRVDKDHKTEINNWNIVRNNAMKIMHMAV